MTFKGSAFEVTLQDVFSTHLLERSSTPGANFLDCLQICEMLVQASKNAPDVSGTPFQNHGVVLTLAATVPSSTRIKDVGIAIRHSRGYIISIRQGPEMDSGGWSPLIHTKSKKIGVFDTKIKKIRVSTFWMSGKLTDSCGGQHNKRA